MSSNIVQMFHRRLAPSMLLTAAGRTGSQMDFLPDQYIPSHDTERPEA